MEQIHSCDHIHLSDLCLHLRQLSWSQTQTFNQEAHCGSESAAQPGGVVMTPELQI